MWLHIFYNRRLSRSSNWKNRLPALRFCPCLMWYPTAKPTMDIQLWMGMRLLLNLIRATVTKGFLEEHSLTCSSSWGSLLSHTRLSMCYGASPKNKMNRKTVNGTMNYTRHMMGHKVSDGTDMTVLQHWNIQYTEHFYILGNTDVLRHRAFLYLDVLEASLVYYLRKA